MKNVNRCYYGIAWIGTIIGQRQASYYKFETKRERDRWVQADLESRNAIQLSTVPVTLRKTVPFWK